LSRSLAGAVLRERQIHMKSNRSGNALPLRPMHGNLYQPLRKITILACEAVRNSHPVREAGRARPDAGNPWDRSST